VTDGTGGSDDPGGADDVGELPPDGGLPDGGTPVDVGRGAGVVVAGALVGSGDRVVRVGLVPPVLPATEGGGRTCR
jgi:hypothetical protein